MKYQNGMFFVMLVSQNMERQDIIMRSVMAN